MDWIFIGITFVVALLAVGNWRMAMFACVVLDVVRDPVRKLTESQSSLTTVIVGIVWLGALIGALNQNQRELLKLFRRFPELRTSLVTAAMAIAPGALISIIYYNHGWILASIGTASYSAPFIGIALGYLWPRRIGDVHRWMALYAIINAVFLVGSFFEAMEFNVPCLGGINMTWLRNHGFDLIKLICGFYRSPDVMGLHAAHVIMFSVLLAIRPRQRVVWFWLAIAGWASIALVLCGRRKMIVIPLIFLVTYVGLMAVFTGRKRIALTMAGFAGLCVAAIYFVAEEIVVENDYARFATSIASEGVDRASHSFTDIIFTTVRQSGWLGDGLGTVTQGRQYLGVQTHGKDWQEDGVGRLFKELGIPGVIGMLAAAAFLLRAIRTSFRGMPNGHSALWLQSGFCGVVVANLASFSVSHQAYSGDPSTVMVVGFCIGIILGLPRPVWADADRDEHPNRMEQLPADPNSHPAPELTGKN